MRDNLPLIIPELKLETTIWIKLLKYKINKRDPNTNIVISDVRFPDEVKAIQELGGIILKINRSSVEPVEICHESENANELKFDDSIDNNGTIEDFYNNINELLNLKTYNENINRNNIYDENSDDDNKRDLGYLYAHISGIAVGIGLMKIVSVITK